MIDAGDSLDFTFGVAEARQKTQIVITQPILTKKLSLSNGRFCRSGFG